MFHNKRLHAKIMTDRIMQYNQKTIPEDQLPDGQLAWVREQNTHEAKRSHSAKALALEEAHVEWDAKPWVRTLRDKRVPKVSYDPDYYPKEKGESPKPQS